MLIRLICWISLACWIHVLSADAQVYDSFSDTIAEGTPRETYTAESLYPANQCCDPQIESSPTANNFGLSGNWLGFRERLANNGITYAGDVTSIYQGTTSGGRDQRFQFLMHQDNVVNFDLDKLAGRKGMFFKLRFEGQYGDAINGDTGGIVAANALGLFPTVGEDVLAVTNLVLTQFLSESVGVYFGKLDTLDGDLNAYAHGRGKRQFMNVGLVATPISFRTVPYSTWGLGLIVLGKEKTPIFGISIIDPNSFATEFNLDEIFSEGVTVTSELRIPTQFFGKPGHQLFAGIWSSRDVALLSSAPLLLLPNSPPLPTSNDSWALYWNFDQQLVSNPCNPQKGWGVFGRAAIADPETNPFEYFLSLGIGGDSPIQNRENDSFGIGWYHAAISDEVPGAILSDSEQGVEIFYNWQIAPGLNLTPDIQIINPAIDGVDTSLLFGMRFNAVL